MKTKPKTLYSLGLSSCELYTGEEMETLTEKYMLAEKAFLPITAETLDSYVELMTPDQIERHRKILLGNRE